jgi:hypothetical protein
MQYNKNGSRSVDCFASFNWKKFNYHLHKYVLPILPEAASDYPVWNGILVGYSLQMQLSMTTLMKKNQKSKHLPLLRYQPDLGTNIRRLAPFRVE